MDGTAQDVNFLHPFPNPDSLLENFFGFDFEICIISLLVMSKY